MAFESIPGVRVTLKDAGRTFIVSDFFSVYEKGEEFPEIHRWSEVEAILETKTDFVVSSKDFSYKIPKTALSDPRKLLNLRGVFEGAVSQYPEIEYTHPKRVLPPKYLYMSGDVKDPPYMASGTYREREINFSNAVLLNTLLGGIFGVIALVVAVLAFVLMHFFYGDAREYWLYFIPVSLFTAGIAVMFVYVTCSIIGNFLYASLFKVDPALTEEITFVVSPEGFSAVESFLHTNCEFIPWGQAQFFIETNTLFLIYTITKDVYWLPKRLFTKDKHTEISKFITERISPK